MNKKPIKVARTPDIKAGARLRDFFKTVMKKFNQRNLRHGVLMRERRKRLSELEQAHLGL